MVAASMTKAGVSAPKLTQVPARSARVAAFTGFKSNKAPLFAKSEGSLAQAVAGRVATVQVGWRLSFVDTICPNFSSNYFVGFF